MICQTRLPICIKRVNKEIENFNDKKYIDNICLELKIFFNDLNITLISKYKTNSIYEEVYNLNILKDNKFYLELSIPPDYPFKPYNINNFRLKSSVNYLKHINNLYDKIRILDKVALIFFFENQYQFECKFLKMNSSLCFCCNSITCQSNWYPNYRIDNILIEYLEIEFIEKFTSKLGYKYLTNLYNNLLKNTYFSKLPNEIIIFIINKNNIL